MKIIIREATEKFEFKGTHSPDEVAKFVLSHRFYNTKMGVRELIEAIDSSIKKSC